MNIQDVKIGDTVKLIGKSWYDDEGNNLSGTILTVVADNDASTMFASLEDKTVELLGVTRNSQDFILLESAVTSFATGDKVRLKEYYGMQDAGAEGIVHSVRGSTVDGVAQMVNVHFGDKDKHGCAIGIFNYRLELVEAAPRAKNILNLITATSHKVGTGDTQAILMSLVEEVGELATELNIENGTKSRAPSEDGVKGEAVDVMIVIGDMLTHLFGSLDSVELQEAVKRKLAKWESK